MRRKIAELRLALERGFDEHHALMLRLHLTHIDQLPPPSTGSMRRSTR
jgi:hypothetical protein